MGREEKGKQFSSSKQESSKKHLKLENQGATQAC